jgi:branched-chain amino acid transport system substrate-binding protein
MDSVVTGRNEERLGLTRRDFGKATLAASAAAAVLTKAPAFAQDTELKVGVLLPRSGYLAQPGQACQRGAEIAATVPRLPRRCSPSWASGLRS